MLPYQEHYDEKQKSRSRTRDILFGGGKIESKIDALLIVESLHDNNQDDNDGCYGISRAADKLEEYLKTIT